MKRSTASNVAIALAVFSWPLVCYGAMSQLGDYAPSTPNEVIVASRHRSFSILVVGLLCWVSSIWLSGYGFSGAKVRSSIAFAGCLSLPLVAIVGLWS
ncbi:hypothetical protein [Pseudoxanthomonas sp.]|uniref:hypothetical protein n=1 Tax=Pseudoxanthomonas sp. TaxID=1871049 RepID=UPI0026166353|nr:hypothetical protein [Pseudoxanthomonas sp.]WDS35243.1 MAG: hypothetical protein O8I58_12860 [Pseudoxanthomonas sp.]